MSDHETTDGELSFFEALGGGAREAMHEYEALLKAHDRPSKLGKRPVEQWKLLGVVEEWQGYKGGLDLTCERGSVNLHWMGQDCIRVTVKAPPIESDKSSYAVVASPPNLPYIFREAQDRLTINSDYVTCEINLEAFQLHLKWNDGRSLYQEVGGAEYTPDGAVRLTSRLQATEHSHGLGERSAGLDLRGGRYALWNTDQPSCDEGIDPLYYCVPFYLGVHENGVYGIFFDNAYRGVVDVGQANPEQLTFEFNGGRIRYYVIVGESINSVVARYVSLTGKPPLPPLWYFGYHQSRFSYHPQAQVLDVARALREHAIPCDVIHLDIDYMNGYRLFTWDEARFPAFREMVSTLHEQGFRVVVIVDPGVKVDANYPVYTSGLKDHVFLASPDGAPLSVVVWAGRSHLPDFTREAARSWWVRAAKRLVDVGIDGFWNDMNEPAVFTSSEAVSLPGNIEHDRDDEGTTHEEAHNLYGMLMSRASREALTTHRPEQRPVNITRAGYAGTQRYATSWTGDVTSSWEHLRLMIPMLLNLNMSGVPFTGADVGGFRDDTNAELLTRWTQAACLTPFFRNHSAIDTVRQEPWAFGDPYLSQIRKAIELRYALLPYLYSVGAQASEYGYPIMRPLFGLEPENTSLHDHGGSFLLGEGLLVAPILHAEATTHDVYLPEGEWYDFWTLDLYDGGGVVTLDVGLGDIPLFVRAGAALPIWPVMQHASNGPSEHPTLRVYPGQLETALYEDVGDGLDYLQGDFRWLYMSVNWVNQRLRITRRVAGRYKPPYEALRVEIVGFDEKPLDVRVDRHVVPEWSYNNGLVELSVGEFSQIEVTPHVGPEDQTIVSRPKF